MSFSLQGFQNVKILLFILLRNYNVPILCINFLEKVVVTLSG